jgi:diguanylate cyclase (GGDEF)-like protein
MTRTFSISAVLERFSGSGQCEPPRSFSSFWGHATGDRFIVAFARELTAAAGPEALVGRLGGEEFGVLLPSGNTSVALLLASRVKSGFSDGSKHGLPIDARPTASFGVAELAVGESLEGAMLRADQALYRAKNEGRDRIRLAWAGPGIVPRPLRLAPA